MKKKQYDTSITLMYQIGQESLLPETFRKEIPYSTISSWRKTSPSKYVGSEYRTLFHDSFEVIALKQALNKLKRVLVTTRQIIKEMRPFLVAWYKEVGNDPKSRGIFCRCVQQLGKEIGLKSALKELNISKDRYYLWLNAGKPDCAQSQKFLCTRRFPNQIGKKDIQRMERLLKSRRYQHWPINAIAAYALRRNWVSASTYSWYRLARRQQLAHPLVKIERPRYESFATQPNECLHADTTYYKMTDSKTVCITFVLDNFSKMILGFAVAEKLSFALVKRALKSSLQTISKQTSQSQSYLVTDGGRENHNSQIDNFLDSLAGNRMVKVRAIKDIQFSNNPVEAIHKIMKGRYLRNQHFPSISKLEQFLKWAVHDYNSVRPHTRHWPRTPEEVYFQKPLTFDPHLRIREGQKRRIKEHLTRCCAKCRLPVGLSNGTA